MSNYIDNSSHYTNYYTKYIIAYCYVYKVIISHFHQLYDSWNKNIFKFLGILDLGWGYTILYRYKIHVQLAILGWYITGYK